MKKLLTSLAAFLLFFTIAMAGCGKAPAGEAVDKAIQKSQDVKSEHVDLIVNLEMTGNPSALGPAFQGLLPLNITINSGFDVDSSDPGSPKARGNISIAGLDQFLNAMAQTQGVDAPTQLKINLISGALANLQFIIADRGAYLKIAGSWYALGDFSSLSGIPFLTPGARQANAQCYRDAMKDPDKFGSDRLMANLQEVGDEKIDGTSTRHFRADIDIDKALTALAEISRDCGDAEAAGGLEASRQEITSFFRKFEMEIWIDNDSNIRQIKSAVETDPRVIADTVPQVGGVNPDAATQGLEALNMNVTLKFSQFGAAFDIAKPEGNIMKIEDLFGGGLGAFGGLGATGMPGGMGGAGGTGTTSTTGSSRTY